MIPIGNFVLHFLVWFKVLSKIKTVKIGDYQEIVEFEPYIPSKRVCVYEAVLTFNYRVQWMINRNMLPALVDRYEVVVRWHDKIYILCQIQKETMVEENAFENINFNFTCESNALQISLKPQSLDELTICIKIGQGYSCHATYKFSENETQCQQPTLNFYNILSRPYLRCILADEESYSDDLTYRIFNVYNVNDVSYGEYIDLSKNVDTYAESEAFDWLCDVMNGNLTVGRALNSYNTSNHSRYNTKKYLLHRLLYCYLPILASCILVFLISIMLVVAGKKYSSNKKYLSTAKSSKNEHTSTATVNQLDETIQKWQSFRHDQLRTRLTLDKETKHPINIKYKELCGANYVINYDNGDLSANHNQNSLHQHSVECIGRKLENESIRFNCNYFNLTPIGLDSQYLLTSVNHTPSSEMKQHVELGLSYQDMDFELTPIKQQILWCTVMYENCTPMVYTPTSSSTSCIKLIPNETTNIKEDGSSSNSSGGPCFHSYSTRGNLIVNNSHVFEKLFLSSYHINRYYEPITEYTKLYTGVSLFQRQPLPHSIMWGDQLIESPLAWFRQRLCWWIKVYEKYYISD